MHGFELFLKEFELKGKLVFEKNKPLSSVSTIGVGGNADFFILPNGVSAMVDVMHEGKKLGVSTVITGNSSNVIYSDLGFRGAVICTKNMNGYRIKKTSDGAKIFAGCGTMLPELSRIALKNGLSGFEGLSSIPGTVGGAVISNAGAYGQSISDNLKGVFLLTDECRLSFRRVEKTMFSYRECRAVKSEETVVGAVFELKYGEKNKIAEKIKYCRDMRQKTQPIGEKSVGSFFKRPNISKDSPYFGLSAGELIERCGLKGLSVGGARVSEKHGNFIINVGAASAHDIIMLAEAVGKTVFLKIGVSLVKEPFLLGDFVENR